MTPNLQLHGFGHSGHTYKVASYLNLAGIPFEPVFLDFFKGAGRAPEYLALNPMGEAPTLVWDGVPMSQSGVILQRLVREFGQFAPADADEGLRWILWDNHKGSSQFGVARFYNNFLPAEKRSADVATYVTSRAQAAIKTLENHLENHTYMVSDSLSIADLSVSSYLFYPEEFGWKRAETPAIDAWLTRIESQPNWRHPYDLMPFDQDMINNTPAARAWHNKE